MTQAEKKIAELRSQRALRGNGHLFSGHYVEVEKTPAMKVEEVLLKVDNLEKPWEKEDLLRRSITRAHKHIIKLNTKTRTGYAKAQEWLLAIDILNDKLSEMDQQGSMMRRALTCTFHLLMGGRSKEIYPRKGVVRRNKDGSEVIGILRNKKAFVVEGVRSFPAEKDRYGNVLAWVPGISVDARMEPRMLAVQGSCWHHKTILHSDGTKDTVTWLQRFATHASPSVRLLGEAEMGREDEFLPLEEPSHGQVEIRRDASSNHIELSNDFDRAFNVVDEERVNRRSTYDPEKEREWLQVMLYAVDSARTPRELVYVMDELIQKAWRAKLVRFNIFEEAHNACVLKGREKCARHPVIGKWTTIGAADMQVPEVTPQFEKWALRHLDSPKVKALQAHWDNLLRREGLGAGFNGQPFSDTSEDALEQKECRAGDGSLDSLDRMLHGDDDCDEDEASTKGGPVYTQAVDTCLSLEDIQKEKINPAEAMSLAAALFGRTRGASVDLIHKPKVSLTPWKSIPRPRTQTYESPEDIINATVAKDMESRGLKAFIPQKRYIKERLVVHEDIGFWYIAEEEIPSVAGFGSLDKAIKALTSF